MPQFIATGFAALGASVATAAALGSLVFTVLVNVALGAVAKALTKKPRQDSSVPSSSLTVRGTVENRRLIFGTRRVAGVMVFYGTAQANNAALYYVVALAGHQVDDIRDVWLDTVKIDDANIDPSTGAVTQGNYTGFLNIYRYTGTSSQTVNASLDADYAIWGSDHRLRGCAYIVVLMRRSEVAFPTGAPSSVSALVDGMRVYDPRLDSTNGGFGGHLQTDPSTWTFSRNPALHLRWYLTGGSVVNDVSTPLVRYGLREPSSRIDDSYFVAAANVCDESVSGANAPPSGAQSRYRCDLEATTGETRRSIIESILASMSGRLVSVHGRWRVYAGDYETPLHALTQDDLFGDMQVQDTTPHTERFNAVAAVFCDAGNDYVDRTTIFRTDSAYETQDGGERLTKEIDLRAVTDQYQAQRLAEIELRRSRMMRTVQIVGGLNLLKVALHENVTFSHARYGWVSRVFRCVERQFEYNEEAGKVSLTLQREDSAVYTDMVTADYTTGTSDTDVFQIEIPDAPTSFLAIGALNGIVFTWTMPTRFTNTLIAELYEYSASTPFASATKIWEGTASSVYLVKTDTTTRYYWLRVRDSRGQLSNPTPAAASPGTPGAASLISTTLFASVSPGSLSVTVTSGSGFTSSAAVVTASGGTPGYTYAWTWLSGGTSITITSASAASTTFSTTGMSAGTSRSGVARCTVTDSASSTRTVDVSVTFTYPNPLSATRSPTSLSTNVPDLNSVTSASTTVTASGGTPGYSYSWAWASGGSGISIVSATSATTTFSTSGLGSGSRTGTARCTVTDSVGATTTVDVTVTFTSTALLAATMTEGYYDDFISTEYLGYRIGSAGSMSSTAIVGGFTLRDCLDSGPYGGPYTATVLIGGFGSDPGATGVFSSITVGGVNRTAASATYLWIGAFGYASWTWASPFGLDAIGTTDVVINP